MYKIKSKYLIKLIPYHQILNKYEIIRDFVYVFMTLLNKPYLSKHLRPKIRKKKYQNFVRSIDKNFHMMNYKNLQNTVFHQLMPKVPRLKV